MNLVFRENQEKYRRLCATRDLPLHLCDWWLDAVCGGAAHWGVSLAFDAGGQITGALPFFWKKRFGLLPTIDLPPLTSYAGPCFFYPQNMQKQASRYAFEKKTASELIAALPRRLFFRQNFRPEITNWLPFFWAGFRQTTRYTYLLSGEPAALWANLKNTVRSDMKKAEGLAQVTREDDPDLMFRLSTLSFHRKGMAQPYDVKVFKRLYGALRTREAGTLFIARDRKNNAAQAGLFLAHDARQASVLLTGLDPQYKATCSIYLLFWEAMLFCAQNGLTLDLEGSMNPDIERVFRSLGAVQTPYCSVWRFL